MKKFRFLSDTTLEKSLDFIALSEVGRRDYSQSFLKNLCVGKDFLGHCKSPSGRSSGILMGINLTTFDIGEIEEGDFFVKIKVRNKSDGFQWLLVSVYGPAQTKPKQAFLAELAHLCLKEITGDDYWR